MYANGDLKRQQQINRINATYGTTLEKGGEGSRGGKVIGHTKSGKAIYENKKADHSDYKHFTAKDHSDAQQIHTDHGTKEEMGHWDKEVELRKHENNTKTEIAGNDKGDKEKIISEFDKELLTKNDDKNIEIISKLTGLSEEDSEEMIFCKRIFETSERPENSAERKEQKRMANFFWKNIEKYPVLEKLGFDVNDVYVEE